MIEYNYIRQLINYGIEIKSFDIGDIEFGIDKNMVYGFTIMAINNSKTILELLNIFDEVQLKCVSLNLIRDKVYAIFTVNNKIEKKVIKNLKTKGVKK